MQIQVNGTFSAQKITQEESAKFRKILNYTNFVSITFNDKMSRYSDWTYCLQYFL